ncbi:hypothetical protein HY496_00375 [Candidatus Woesearchaeota archaeon]|nr:hypothetical protein [Candidatus Woesearchaeota archaeon]
MTRIAVFDTLRRTEPVLERIVKENKKVLYDLVNRKVEAEWSYREGRGLPENTFIPLEHYVTAGQDVGKDFNLTSAVDLYRCGKEYGFNLIVRDRLYPQNFDVVPTLPSLVEEVRLGLAGVSSQWFGAVITPYLYTINEKVKSGRIQQGLLMAMASISQYAPPETTPQLPPQVEMAKWFLKGFFTSPVTIKGLNAQERAEFERLF